MTITARYPTELELLAPVADFGPLLSGAWLPTPAPEGGTP